MWPSTTAGYEISNSDDVTTLYTLPTADQQALMDQSYQADGIVDANVPATVGMFGDTTTNPDEPTYWFYFYFKQATLYQDVNVIAKTLRVIFQMGNGSSDWEGVRWYYDTGAYATDYYELLPCSITNSNLAQISSYEENNSDFTGYINPTTGYLTIFRQTLDDEQTTDDGSIIRIEKGRILQAYYWDAQEARQGFEIILSGAFQSMVALTAGAIATMGLLTF